MFFQIIINKKPVSVNNNMTILQACESANIIVPKFCYHERLSIAGNCRMCLVEIEKAPKLVASCAMPVLQNMVVHTNSLAVKKAREGVLEFLLINHPLDCGICDQAGECDLQEQSKGFGSDRGRFQENKRAVQDFECGPLIKTIMTRCIHCTRCVRFANEIIGLPDLGTSGRGGSLEINLYIKKLFKSEFSGNLIDLCPVGALTSKPYTFMARSWELKSIESIDVLDGIGSNIRLDTRGYELMRVLPRLNENINEEWISDKTRFAFDGLRHQRLYEPLVKNVNNKFEVITWKSALNIIVQYLYKLKFPYKFGAVVGPQADFESLCLLNFLIKKYNGNFVEFENLNLSLVDFKSLYLFNSNIKNLENADVCLLLGVNPRIEGAILNLRLRKRYLAGNFKIASFGSFFDVSFPIYNLGSTISSFLTFLEGQHVFSKYFSKGQKPIVIIGRSFFETIGEKQTFALLKVLIKNSFLLNNKWCGINILNNYASDCGKNELGIKTYFAMNFDLKLLYVIGEGKFKRLNSSTFIVYQGYQANKATQMANLILPGKSFTEKISTFVNIEGRYQLTKIATNSPVSSKDDWSVLYAILEKSNINSFIKTYVFPDYENLNLISTYTFLQKIEMDPFYGLSDIFPNIIELNLNYYNLSVIIINTLKELNFEFPLHEEIDEMELKNFSEMPQNYPDIYQIYLAFTEIVHDIMKFFVPVYPFGLMFLSDFQKKLYYYKFMSGVNFFELLEFWLEVLEPILLRYKYALFIDYELVDIEINYVGTHFRYIVYSNSFFYSNLIQCIIGLNTQELNESLIFQFNFALDFINENSFIKRKKFLNILPELVRKIAFSRGSFLQAKCPEFFYAIFSFYKKKIFTNNNFLNRFKQDVIFDNTVFSASVNGLYIFFYDLDIFCESYDQNLFDYFFFEIECNLSFYEKEIFYYFDYYQSIWIKYNINRKNFFSVNDIKSMYIASSNLNILNYQSTILKNVCFSKLLTKIFSVRNKIIPSSKFDNFYLMNDFSKLSLLMKHCSDTFLERSPFKK